MHLAFGYRRVSRPERESGTVSLESQEKAIRDHCRAAGLTLQEIYTDDGVSAARPLDQRQGGRQLLAAAAAGQCVVVAAKLDRLFRSGLDFYSSVAKWDRDGIRLVCIAEAFDLGTIFGRAFAGILSVIAELERGLIAARVQAGVKVRRARGERVSRDAAYGTRFEATGRVNAAGREIMGIVPDLEEIAVIRSMMAMRRKKKSFAKIAAELDRRGVKPRRAANWSSMSVRRAIAGYRARASHRAPDDGHDRISERYQAKDGTETTLADDGDDGVGTNDTIEQ